MLASGIPTMRECGASDCVCVCLCVFLFDLLKKDMGQHLCPGVRNGETFYTLCSPISSLYVLGCFFSGTMTRGR